MAKRPQQSCVGMSLAGFVQDGSKRSVISLNAEPTDKVCARENAGWSSGTKYIKAVIDLLV